MGIGILIKESDNLGFFLQTFSWALTNMVPTRITTQASFPLSSSLFPAFSSLLSPAL